MKRGMDIKTAARHPLRYSAADFHGIMDVLENLSGGKHSANCNRSGYEVVFCKGRLHWC